MRCFILFAALISMLAAASPAPASKIRVPILHRIQSGIDAASDGDTVLVANGRYYGPGNRDIDFRGKSIVVISENGADATIVDAAGHVGFIFSGGEDACTVLSGFTITDGDPGISCAKASPRITGNIIRDNERGMYIYDDSDPVIEDNLIEQNGDLSYAEGLLGAGIRCSHSNALIRGNVIRDNEIWSDEYEGGAFGAGLCAEYSNISFFDNLVEGNVAYGEAHGSAPYGAGIALVGRTNALIEGNTIRNNRGEGCYNGAMGGGIYCYSSGKIRLVGNTIEDNYSVSFVDLAYGGGIYGYVEEITHCKISNNSADGGGGICGLYGNIGSISDCVISYNRAYWAGGGIYGVVSELKNCTVYENGEYTYCGGGLYGMSAHITNCIFWNNHASYGHEIYFGNGEPWNTNPWGRMSVTFSDMEGGLDGIYVEDPDYSLYWGQGNIDADPLLADPENDDYELLPGSPCIDTGTPDIPPGPWGGRRLDMGAYEYDQGFYWDGQDLIYKPFPIEFPVNR